MHTSLLPVSFRQHPLVHAQMVLTEDKADPWQRMEKKKHGLKKRGDTGRYRPLKLWSGATPGFWAATCHRRRQTLSPARIHEFNQSDQPIRAISFALIRHTALGSIKCLDAFLAVCVYVFVVSMEGYRQEPHT